MGEGARGRSAGESPTVTGVNKKKHVYSKTYNNSLDSTITWSWCRQEYIMSTRSCNMCLPGVKVDVVSDSMYFEAFILGCKTDGLIDYP